MSDAAGEHRYTLELYKREPKAYLGAVPVVPDFEPALEWANFRAVRYDPARPLVLDGTPGWVEPRWDEDRGEPYVGGLRAVVAAEGRPAVAADIPLGYFSDLAQAASAQFVTSGELASGEIFEYRVCAYPSTRRDHEERRPEEIFAVQPVPQEVPLDGRSLDDFMADSPACGEVEAESMPAFVPREVLAEVAAMMDQAGDLETGGILIGHLHRDQRRPEVFLEVTAQVPAEHAEHELSRLTFTPDTWAAVDAALELRGRGERYVGWWHTHPSGQWCQQCPPETQARCRAAGKTPGDFFSTHDAALHRAVFPRAYSVALVLAGNCRPEADPVWKSYGWQYGLIRARGFYILGGSPQPVPAMAGTQKKGDKD